MRGEIIVIGDELISGRIRDINAHYLSTRLTSLGMQVLAISTVGDIEEHIFEVLGRAAERSGFVIVCGGLGPTSDDITADTAAKFFKRPLALDKDYLSYIRSDIERRGFAWQEAYEKLACFPEGSEIIDPRGHACGFSLVYREVPFFFLPGVPGEVRQLTETRVLSYLTGYDKDPAEVRQGVFKIFGLTEARIEELLQGLVGEDSHKAVLIGYYPSFPENHVSITVRYKTAAEAEETLAELGAELRNRLGPWLVAENDATLEQTVGRGLLNRGLTLSVAESCTGGLISHRLTEVPGSSEYFERSAVVYSNRSKTEMLGVDPETIENFGAVSHETAQAMARGIRQKSGASLGLATTGIAGPAGGTEEKPVGTVYIALADAEGVEVKHYRFSGDRRQNKVLTAETALNLVRQYLEK